MRVVETIEQIKGMIEKDDFQPSKIEEVKSAYQDLSHDEKPLFFQELIRRVETSRDQIEGLMEDALAAKEGDPLWNKILANLRTKSESPRMKFFRQFINISEGLKFLLDVRTDLLALQRREEFDFSPLDQDLAYLINSWFQSGFLVLQEITLDSIYWVTDKKRFVDDALLQLNRECADARRATFAKAQKEMDNITYLLLN